MSSVGIGVLLPLGDSYESDVSESGTAVGSEIISSAESSPVSLSAFSAGGGHGIGFLRRFGLARPTSSAESLLFTSSELGAASGAEAESTQEAVLESQPEEGVGNGLMLGTLEVMKENETTPKKRTDGDGAAPPDVPKKLTGRNFQSPSRRRLKPKAFDLVNSGCQKWVSLKSPVWRQRRQRQRRRACSTPSLVTPHGIQKIASRIVRTRVKPVETLLASISESIRYHISDTVRKEVEGAFAEVRSLLDGRLPVPKNKAKAKVVRRGKTKGQKEIPEKHVDVVQHKVEVESKKTDDSDCNSEDIFSKTTDPCLTSAESSPAAQEGTKRIVWKKKGMRSANLVDKLKKYLDQKEPLKAVPFTDIVVSNRDERTYSSGSSQDMDICTPPNSPVSNDACSSSSPTPAFTLGMVKVQLLTEASKFIESEEMEAKLGVGNTSEVLDKEIVEGEEVGIKVDNSESHSTIAPTVSGMMGLGLTKIGAEFELKPELPLRKSKESINCHYCGKQFQNKSSLKQHISFHRPQRPYECDHDGCDKSYKTRSELNRHTIVHTGQKNHVCKQCGKKFLRKQYLKTHLFRHSEPLTWQCTLCSKIFVSEEDLSKHKVSYHKNGKRASAASSSSSSQSFLSSSSF